MVGAQQGVFYMLDTQRATTPQLTLLASYAYERAQEHRQARSSSAKGWSASARSRSRRSCSTNVPTDYIRISSGLGEAPPLNIIVLPVVFEGQVQGGARAGVASSASTRRTRRSSTS